eukprot:UN02160
MIGTRSIPNFFKNCPKRTIKFKNTRQEGKLTLLKNFLQIAMTRKKIMGIWRSNVKLTQSRISQLVREKHMIMEWRIWKLLCFLTSCWRSFALIQLMCRSERTTKRRLRMRWMTPLQKQGKFQFVMCLVLVFVKTEVRDQKPTQKTDHNQATTNHNENA